MLNDVTHALRALLRRPRTPVVAIACLALGVGASTALFNVIDALLFKPPAGVADAGRLTRVRIGQESRAGPMVGNSATYPQYQTVRRQEARLLLDLAAYAGHDLTLGTGPDARP